MLYRDTENHGLVEVNATTEVSYEAQDGMKTVIPLGDHWRQVLVQTSGGLDSALLLYLVSKTLKEVNSKAKIIPLSLEVPIKAKNLSSARAVISKVREITENPNILPGIEIGIPVEKSHPPHKNQFFNDVIMDLYRAQVFDFEMNGNTKNPPEEVRRDFLYDEYRQTDRDSRLTIYNAPISASPHAMIDKSGIVYLYQKEGLIDELAPLTLSCDMNLSEIEERNLSVPCGICWWCRERQWGFDSNQLKDPAQLV